jgi:hypothetical protein
MPHRSACFSQDRRAQPMVRDTNDRERMSANRDANASSNANADGNADADANGGNAHARSARFRVRNEASCSHGWRASARPHQRPLPESLGCRHPFSFAPRSQWRRLRRASCRCLRGSARGFFRSCQGKDVRAMDPSPAFAFAPSCGRSFVCRTIDGATILRETSAPARHRECLGIRISFAWASRGGGSGAACHCTLEV